MLMNLALTASMFTAHAFGESPECTVNPLSPACIVSKIGKDTNLPDFVKYNKHPDAPTDTQYDNQGVDTVVSPIYYAIDIFRFAISGIMMIYVIILVIKLVSGAADEEVKKAKERLVYMIIGLLIVQFAGTLVKRMFFGDYGEAFSVNEDGERVSQDFAFNSAAEIRGIIGLIEIFIGVVAVLVIVVRGITLVVSGGEEESMKKARNHILYAVVGLVLAGFSEIITRFIVFPDAGTSMPSVETGQALIAQITNFVAGFIAIAAFIMLFYAGYRYVVAGVSGEEGDKIKKIFIGAIIGLVLSMSAFAIVNTVMKFEKPLDTSTVNNYAPEGTTEGAQ